MLAFDEVPLSYSCPEAPAVANNNNDANENNNKPMAPVAFNSENISTFLGISKFVDPGMRNAAGAFGNDNNDGMGSEENSLPGEDSFDSQIDEIEERKYVRAYWRADEG